MLSPSQTATCQVHLTVSYGLLPQWFPIMLACGNIKEVILHEIRMIPLLHLLQDIRKWHSSTNSESIATQF